jgi:membrane protease YdiL (CAAX protease family)
LRASRAIGLYAVAVILLGALLAPWLFWGVQRLTTQQPPAAWSFATYPFHRIFDRSVMIVALAGLWPLLRAVGFRSWRELGYARARGWWRHLLGGWALGVASFALIILVIVAMGSRSLHFDKTAGQMAGAALRYLLAGVAIALIEETLFRGALQGALQRGMRIAPAVVLASAVYSAMHFLKPMGVNIPANQVGWDSGFTCLAGIVSQALLQRDVLVEFVTLFLAGCVLGLAYARTGALYLPIGLHAGWVLANESARFLGARGATVHVVAWPMLALLLLVIARLCRTTFKPLRALEPSGSGPGARLT